MTAEDHVAYSLREFYLSFPQVDIISFHPPSGKAYETHLIRFPVLENLGMAAKRRHLDFIVRCGRFLVLQELKGDAASSAADLRPERGELAVRPSRLCAFVCQ